MKYHIRTFGCQMNYSDTERVMTVLEKMNYKQGESFEDSDLIIINTCAIKQHAEDRVVGLQKQFKPLKKKNPNLKVGITGCMVRNSGVRGESDDRVLKMMDTVDFVFEIKELMKLPEMLHKVHHIEIDDEVSDLLSYFHISPKITNFTQVYSPIQRGCNNYCSFCIVPFARGKEVSRSMAEMLEEIQKFVKRGASEINLVGQNVNSYNPSDKDTNSNEDPFATLLKKIDAMEGVKRIRFFAVHPKDMTDEVVNLYGSLKSMVPHLHLPLQSGSETVLKRMNRRYTPDEFRTLVAKLRKRIPHMSITTDIIVGFCGETEEEFQETYDLLKELKIDLAYTSQYSQRKGTLAERALKDNITQDEKKRRFHVINDLIRKLSEEYNQRFIGKACPGPRSGETEVLVEKVQKGYASGKNPEFKYCRFPVRPESHSGGKSEDKDLIGKYVTIKVNQALEWALEGEPVG